MKQIYIILLVFLLCLPLIACSNDGPSNSPILMQVDSTTSDYIIHENLINNAQVMEKTYVRDTGELVSPAHDFFTLIVPCKPNTSYRLVFPAIRFITYYDNDTLISGYDYEDSTAVDFLFTTPSNCNIIQITGYYSGSPSDMEKNLDSAYLGTDIAIIKYDRLSPNYKVNMLNMPLDYIDTTNVRVGCISFIFDDGCSRDQEIFNVFTEYGLTCGFALPTYMSDSNIQTYKAFYNNGFSILSHSIDGNTFSDETLSISQAKDRFRSSRQALEHFGFKISGWVTPSSQMNEKYIPALENIYSYGYTEYFNHTTSSDAPYNTLSDHPCRLKRRYLGGNNLEELQQMCNEAIENEGFLTFYYHSRDLDNDFSIDTLRQLLAWLKTKRDNYECEILPPDLAIRYYYRSRITD